MQYRILGKTGLSASAIGYGCNKIADRDVDPKEVEATIESALDHGINLFDTADAYAGGESERLLGRVLRPHRKKILLCSKAGYRSWLRVALENTIPVAGMFGGRRRNAGKGAGKAPPNTRSHRNFAPRILAMAIENSLRRLQTDYLDLFYLHSPPQEIAAAPEVFEALKRIQQKGWIRHYGISFYESASTAEVLHCLPNDAISVLQFQMNLQETLNVPNITASAGGSAIVARQPFRRGAIFSSTFANVPLSGRTLAQTAIQFVLQQDGVHSVLVGMRSRKHLAENLGGIQAEPLPASLMQQIQSRLRMY